MSNKSNKIVKRESFGAPLPLNGLSKHPKGKQIENDMADTAM